MKQKILDYSLEMFSFAVLVYAICFALFFREDSHLGIITAFMLCAVMHEFEEKRVPGGFFELMAKKFGIRAENDDFRKHTLIVVIYWIVMLSLPLIFRSAVFLPISLSCVGIFEAFIHTAGIKIHKLRKPYTPGLVSAWIMAGVSVYTLRYVSDIAGTADYVIGAVFMVVTFLMMDVCVLRSFNVSISDVRKNMKGNA
ncbi:MAG: HXXEE domain-containing protein [Firmicutes bacterium]|nr:HXXEE domain-containing protein [Bacillota bacterium]